MDKSNPCPTLVATRFSCDDVIVNFLLGLTVKVSMKSYQYLVKMLTSAAGSLISWPILYDSTIVFLRLRTPDVYLKLNIISLK